MSDYGFERSREKYIEQAADIRSVVEKIVAGTMPAVIPWTEPVFQTMLLHAIGDLRRFKADADKLAVLKEVFGGAR